MTEPSTRDAAGEEQARLDSFFSVSPEDLRETIQFLIDHRELLRDEELARLESEARQTRAKLDRLDREKLSAELECFKDVLALHKRLVENGGSRR